jgi:hypothetical protein
MIIIENLHYNESAVGGCVFLEEKAMLKHDENGGFHLALDVVCFSRRQQVIRRNIVSSSLADNR